VSRDVRVLVVDDSDFYGSLVADKLSNLYGMETGRETNGRDALDRLAADEFDCVVSDYDMPGMDGLDLFEALRERGITIPFFLVTAAGSEEIASRAITAGVTDYFPKAESEEQFEILGKRVQNVVDQRRAKRNLQSQRRLHEELWTVIQNLMHASTRADIDGTVCETLVDVDRFTFAWVSDGTTESDPRTVAGIDPDDLDAVRTTLAEGDDDRAPTVAARDEQATRAARLDTPVGDTVEVVAVPLLYQGSSYGVLGLGTDERLTESEGETLGRLGTTVGHALATVEIEREVQVFREAVEQADPAIVITETDGTIEYVNAAFQQITGYSTEEACGQLLHDIVTAEWDEEYAGTIRDRVRDGEPIREEIVQHRKAGAQFYADLSIAPIAINGEDVSKFVAIESDITDLKSREQRLQVLTRVLRHNLRNDLNVVQGHLSLLLDQIEESTSRNHAHQAQEKLEALLDLSETVRLVDKTVQAASEAEPTDPPTLSDLLAREVEQIREAYSDVTVTLETATDTRVETTHLDVAIRELLCNAVEHNDSDQPHVTVRTTDDDADGEFVTVEIEDDGPGIPDLEQEVLERGKETELKHGRSLGLWMVNWVVTHEGGTLTIQEASEDGSVVALSVPLA
jgi:PAS domain S-box-containing protein